MCPTPPISLSCHGDLPRVHRSERGARRRALQLERVAVEPAGGDPDGGPGVGALHPAEGAARPAAHPVRAGPLQPGHLPRRAQPPVVRIATHLGDITVSVQLSNTCVSVCVCVLQSGGLQSQTVGL